jgi:NADH-quinone oxidoreductase subunit M
VFLALDFFHWFLFWELSLLPAFFLIKLWGGPGATRAAYQFVVYTIGGSAFMLVGFAALFAPPAPSISPARPTRGDGTLGRETGGRRRWGHRFSSACSWVSPSRCRSGPSTPGCPATYAEAPTGRVDVPHRRDVEDGRLRFPPDPLADLSGRVHARRALPARAGLRSGCVFGAFAALQQTDLKRMVAYSSINHLSYCLLALFAVSYATGRSGPPARPPRPP